MLKDGVSREESIENIDIGEPTLLAARLPKNYRDVAVIIGTRPDYTNSL